MLNLQVALARNLGLVAATTHKPPPEPPPKPQDGTLAVRHVFVWNLTDRLAKRHVVPWSLYFVATHRVAWALRLTRVQRLPYADLRRHTRTLNAAYGDRPWVRSALRTAYAEQVVARSSLRLPYADCTLVRSGLRLDFAEVTNVRVALSLRYGDSAILRARLRSPFADQDVMRSSLRLPYADCTLVRSGLRLDFAEVANVRVSLSLRYGDSAILRARLRTPFADQVILHARLDLPYGLMSANRTRFLAGYALSTNNPVIKRHAITWSLRRDQMIQSVANTQVMRWQSVTLPIIQARLSCDEGSPVWIAGIELAHLADFAAIAIGDHISLQLGTEIFALIVDGKTLSRESQTRQRYELTAISPLALLDAPFAATIRFYQAEVVMARMAVEALVGAVDWQLPDWRIPAGRLLMEGVTPLAAARSLVASIGGIVESQPDGTVVCRRRHPVSIPDYVLATVAHALFDGDVLASRAQIAPAHGFNRVTLANEESASTASADRIEYVVDPDNANQGTLRVYLALARPVLLTHTGHPQTVIAALGNVTRKEHEVVEFIEGRASTRYPVMALERAVWQHADLGTVKAEAMSLVSTVPGYSLLDLVYTTTSLDWRVALAADEEVQFILIDV